MIRSTRNNVQRLPLALLSGCMCVLVCAWMVGQGDALASPAGSSQPSKLPKYHRLTDQLKRWMQPRTRRSSSRQSKLLAQVANNDLVPDIEPVAPLPKVFRKVKVLSEPSGVGIVIQSGDRRFPCLPANRTPCVFEVTGKGTIKLDIVVRHLNRTLRYRRNIEGSSITVDLWLLKIPISQNPSTILTPHRLTPKPSPTNESNGALKWVLIGLGGVVVVGAVVAGVMIASSPPGGISFRIASDR